MRFLFAIILSFIATTTNAQVISAQHHWTVFGKIEHTHVECDKNVLYKTFTGQLVVNCQFQLFHVDGTLTQVWSNLGVLVWDSTNSWSATAPNGIGDPAGVKVITAKFYLESKYNNGSFPQHGWGQVNLTARTQFNDGSVTDTQLIFAMYSMINPLVPESVVGGEGIILSARCNPHSPRDPVWNAWGNLVSEFHSKVPTGLIPAGTIANPEVFYYGYGTPASLSSSIDLRLDPDLHHGIPGTQLPLTPTFNTTGLSTGDHKFAFIGNWKTNTGVTGLLAPNEEASCLMVVPETITDGGTIEPPPVVIPPVITTWQEIISKVFRLNDTIKICNVTDNKCTDPVTVH